MKKYGDRFLFVVVYAIEAHPLGSPSPYWDREWPTDASYDAAGKALPQPAGYEERVALARKCIREIGISPLVLIDGMDNAVWCSYGGAPNNGYLIGQDGRIVTKHGWYKAEAMEMAINGYLRTESAPS